MQNCCIFAISDYRKMKMEKAKIVILFLIFAMLMPTTTSAQRRRSVRKPQKKEEKVQEDPRLRMMLEATQQVVFIDSMVVKKDNFISHIPLSKECGILMEKNQLGQYTNELGDRRLATMENTADSTTHITISDLIANQWTTPTPIKGIGDETANYPYLMPDGITLYYAQKGEKSIGGFDIFVTRYNGENNAFLRPENIGMPFSSEANDYLYVIDEAQQLGYFVTDRRQPEGMVCIYVFIPTTSRRIYPTESYSEEKIRSLAAITRIADTWGDEQERKLALQRLKEAKAGAGNSPLTSRPSPLTSHPSSELDKMKHEAYALKKTLEAARKYYASASEDKRFTMREEILNSEQKLEQLQLQIRQKEKEERNKLR